MPPHHLLVFISAFAAGDDGAIHAYQLSLDDGRLELVQKMTDIEHPFFMALSSDHSRLYSVHAPNVFGGEAHEQVVAFRVDPSGRLLELNRQSTHGTASCYLDVAPNDRCVLVANYSTGSVAALPVRKDGSLGDAQSIVQHRGGSVDSERQQGPHAHAIVASPDGRFVLSADLGLDKILTYQLRDARLHPSTQPYVRTEPGAGPRHLTFHPRGKQVYVINEMGNSVTHFDYLADDGLLIEQQTTSTLPENDDQVSHCADLKITPNGKFLYGTNRGHDSIAGFRIEDDGSLSRLMIEPSRGKGPQNLAITPDGRWLLCANMPGNNVTVFRIDGETGGLTATQHATPMPGPACIMIAHRIGLSPP